MTACKLQTESISADFLNKACMKSVSIISYCLHKLVSTYPRPVPECAEAVVRLKGNVSPSPGHTRVYKTKVQGKYRNAINQHAQPPGSRL